MPDEPNSLLGQSKQSAEYVWQVCDHCGWLANISMPVEVCPNGCGPVLTSEPTVAAGELAAALSRLARRVDAARKALTRR